MSIGAGPQMSNYPYGFANGITIRGVPVMQTFPGRAFWVYNGTALAPGGRGGSDGNRGSFESPFASIAGALLQCAAGRGDTIFVKPGHVESVTAAAGLNLNIAGVSIVGLGQGSTRPQVNFTTANTASITVTAAQVSISNIQFDATGFAAVATPIVVSAADFSFLGNDMILATATNQAALGIVSTAAADRMTIDSNRFRGSANAGTATAVQVVGGDSHQITNNLMFGSYTAGIGGINNITTAMTGALISGNTISNQTASSTKAVVAVAGSTVLGRRELLRRNHWRRWYVDLSLGSL